MSLRDGHGRLARGLRVSVTDRCDMRCVYCMPASGHAWLPERDILDFAEIARLAQVFVGEGVRRIRLTGGEPLLRPGLTDLVRLLSGIPGVEDLSLTTNGARLGRLARPLKEAGLTRVTVSLDSLDPARFAAITRGGRLEAVWEGILAADAAGLSPLKLNCVVVPGNEEDLAPLAALTLERDWEVRFIEAMPVSSALGLGVPRGIGMDDFQGRLESRWGPLERLEAEAWAPARRFRLPGAAGSLGFIRSVTEPFCAACDRLRLGADGRLQLCMAHPDGIDLRGALRAGADDGALAATIRAAVLRKPAGHAFFREPVPVGLAMSRIGG